MRVRTSVLLLSLLVSPLAFSRSAAAQGAASNEAAAEALFNEARTAIEAGRVEEGCKKLEASQTLDPGTGTLLHLADCYEKLGRTATAWARFREAASRAARDGRTDWETIAKTRSAELEPKLAKLRIDAPAGVPGLVVERDGAAIPAAALGSALPTDPGEHTVTAKAPGKKPWSARVNVAAASVAAVAIPALEADASAHGDAAVVDTSSSDGSSLRTVGYVVGGLGIVGLAIGTVTGLAAASKNSRSKEICPTSGICADDSARATNDDARSAATISTVGFVAGGALLLGGAALVIFAPSSPASSAPRASARVKASPQALWLEGTW